jgi:hypothetical protein
MLPIRKDITQAQILAAMKGQHQALDYLLAKVCLLDNTFMPPILPYGQH